MLLDNSILDICNYEYEFFLRKANIQGIGLGYKVINGHTTSEKAIQVYVSKKIDKLYLSIDNLIPTCYKGIKTDVIETGLSIVDTKLTLPSNGLTSRVRPLTSGYSIGPSNIPISGTYSALVTDKEKCYILGNNHFLANINSLPLNFPILQPSFEDRGKLESDNIAKLSKYVPLKGETFFYTPTNYVDCAIAEVLIPGSVSPDITFIGRPRGIINPMLGLEIQAACRTSTYFSGKISAIGVTKKVLYSSLGPVLFKNQFLIDYPCKPGDSGALIMTFDKKVVGIIMSRSVATTTCNPIQTVLEKLNVSLVL